LTGVGASAFVGVVTAAQSGTTTIDLSLGNSIYFTQDTNTTVAFANTTTTQKLKFIRVKDDTTTARTITWPSSIIWNGGTAPTLIDSNDTNDVQIFNLTTIDQGVTWYGYETMKNEPSSTGLYSWGNNNNGQLGHNDIIPRSSPVQIPGTQWALITSSSCNGSSGSVSLLKTDSSLWAWGANDSGLLGLNDVIPRSSPIQVPGTQWSETNTSNYATFAAKTDGSLWVWGTSHDGNLGLNESNASISSPVQIPGTWSKFSASSYQSAGAGIKNDGTLWIWGMGSFGGLGLNDTVNYSSPKQVPGTEWSNVSTGGRGSVLAVKNNGTLWSWGYGRAGILATNSITYYSSPRQVPGTQWTSAKMLSSQSGTNNIAGGIKSDGTLWSWGYGSSTGQNDIINRSSPTQIPGTQWQDITNNNYLFSIMGLKTDKTLWAWGYNGQGNLGLNDEVPYSSPTQVPGTQWTQIHSGFAIKS
jgi:hypothetical protein